MAEYNIVKFCRLCRKRYVVGKSDSKKNYCDACQVKANKSYEEESKNERNSKVF
ncbi:hypothetical protein J4212_04820 [Candidatus Woesearchaeota archaeon]|nr:hypothetical protein [Candidatus Woesearchaeota archaeon]